MRSTLSVSALVICFIAVAPRSPTDYGIFIAAIVIAVIADFIARTRTKQGLVSSAPVPPSSSLLLSSSSSISTPSRTNPEVFLSFRGPDTRKRFTDHLYHGLINARINVFKDNEDLYPGEEVSVALLESIEQSNISIPIISKNYTYSQSCLMELVKMLECKKEKAQQIMPIFYDISPSQLRNLSGGVQQAFRKHENRGVDREVIDKWKRALQEISDIVGHNLPSTNNGHEGELVKKVVSQIQRLLKKNDLVVTGSLVGIEPHVQEVMRKLRVIPANEEAPGLSDKYVGVLGICGMPGIGKTTIAKVVYNEIKDCFQGCSFLPIRENGKSNTLTGLQERSISDLLKQKCKSLSTPDEGSIVIANSFRKMKVLILLDDVYDFDQIKLLVGNLNWFGLGSRILMTVRKKDFLKSFRIHEDGVADMDVKYELDEYEVAPMETCQALQLFHKLAFCGYPPEEEEYEYNSLSRGMVDIIGGLPLAIEMTASYLHKIGWDIKIWRDTLHKLEKKPDDKVKEAFQTSYGYLDEETRQIFLDIACWVSGMDKRIPSYMWDACDYFPSTGIRCLHDLCLINIGENNELHMHNQLEVFGREIVQMENPKKSRKRSRLWNTAAALSTLIGEESAKKVEALCLAFDEGQSRCRCERFGHLPHLRFLRLDQASIGGTSQNVLSYLRWLHWQGCRKISELLIFDLKKLVILDLSNSLVNGDSQEWGQILEKAKELKVLILSGCSGLHATPNFHTSMCLEMLVLECCPHLSSIGRSIGNLNSLVCLNLKFCRLVEHLPEELCDMTALEELLIDGTSIRSHSLSTSLHAATEDSERLPM